MPEAKTDGLRGRWRLVDGPEELKISDERITRISEVSERIVRFVSISASEIAPCYTPLANRSTRAQVLTNRHRPPLQRVGVADSPQEGPPEAPVTTSCPTSHHDAISITKWRDAGASAGHPWQSRPGSLGQPAPSTRGPPRSGGS